MGRLDGRVALVTGAGRGFGRAIALAFGSEGADLVVNYNASGPAAKEVVAELERLGRRAEAVQADVARADQVRAMVERVLARFGRLDILVNCAVFLAAEDAHYLTGQVLQPNGGWVMA